MAFVGPPAASSAASGKLRVLHVLPRMTLGGAETLLYRLATCRSGFEHEVIILAGRGWYSPVFEQAGITTHHLNIESIRSAIRAIPELRRLIRGSDADLVQSWLYIANIPAGIFGRAAGLPVVWGIHTSSLGPIGWTSRMAAYAGGALSRWLPDFVINCSTRSEQLHRRLGYGRAEGAVIHNGYDPGAFFPDEAVRSATREALGISASVFLTASIGRWSAQKDFPNLLEALRLAADRGVPVQCLLIGPELTSQNIDLMDAVRAAGCDELVVLLGPRPDLKDLNRATDLHILASSGGEAFPNVVAETMLSGTPNAVTDVGDSALMVGKTGWVVPPKDPVRLGEAIVDAYRQRNDDPLVWQSRRAAARKQISENFTFKRMAEAYEAIWRSVAKCK